jgi:thioredoxin 1
MATINATHDDFEDLISKNDFVIIDFWAPWCGPCKSFAPVYEELSEKYPDIVFAKVDTEAEQELAGSFNIRSIPTLMIMREQIILFSQAGALQASQLEEVIVQAKSLDMEQVRKEVEEQQAEKEKPAEE